MAQYTEYHPLKFWLDPASIAEIVAHIQKYLVDNPINSTTEIETIIHDYLIAHPELIGGVESVNGETGEVVLTADNISGGENVTIKDVLDSLQDQIDDIVASIPSDYQQLIDDVSDLKSATEYDSIAALNKYAFFKNGTVLTSTDNGRKVTRDGNKLTVEKIGNGSTYGVYPLIGDLTIKSGSFSSSDLKTLYEAGNYVKPSDIAFSNDVVSLLLKETIIPKVAGAQGFQIGLYVYNPSTETSEAGFLSPIQYGSGFSFYKHDVTDIWNAAVKYDNLIVFYQRRSGGDTGTKFDVIINLIPTFSREIEDINQRIAETRELLADKADRKNTDISGARRSYHRIYTKVDFSGIDFLDGIDMQVFSDGYSTIHNMDLALYKNTSQNTHNVSDQSALESALQNAVSGDTILLSSGVYTPITLNKSINLIGQGRVVFANQTLAPFATTSTAGVFKTSQTFDAEPPMILDLSRIDDGIILPLTKASTLNECIAAPGSWVLYKSIIYIHPSDGVMPAATDLVIVSKTGATPIIKCYDFSENATVYLENIIAVGGRNCLLCSDYGSYNNQKVIAKNCKFYYSQTTNSVSLFGVVGLFQNCESAYSVKDGFNYHINTSAQWPGGPNTGTLSHGLEIDCIGHDNGLGEAAASPSDNGSTIHDGGTIVRIGGVYYGNCGGNVADKEPDTISYNYDCLAFDSTAPKDTNSADFWASTSTQMYLFGCRAKGSSQYNLFANDNAQIHANLCEYDTSTGDIVG